MTSCYQQGSPDSKILLLGEAPSFNEIREGKPFVGPAGDLLERCLHAAGIARAECYILNCFETQIKKPKDEGSKIYGDDGTLLWTSTRGYSEAGQAATAGTLARVRASGANIICCLGAPALSLVVDNRPISKWRGSVIEGIDGRKVIPSLHPSFALRGAYEARYLNVSDLKKVKAQSASPEISLTKRSLKIDPSFVECVAYLDACLQAEIVATDIEVLRGQVDCFSLALSPVDAISIPIVDAGFEHRWTPEEETIIWQKYAAIFGNPAITKLNQNIAFDLSTLLTLNNIVPEGPLHDSMIAMSVVYPFLRKGLATICSMFTDVPYYKDDSDLTDTPTVADFARRWLYSAKDSAVAFGGWEELMMLVDGEDYRPTYDMHISTLPALIDMMVRGIKVNRPALEETRIQAEADLETLLVKVAEAFAMPIITEAPKTAKAKREAAGKLNVNSSKQLLAYFYEKKGIKPYLGKEGNPTLDDTALARIIRRDNLQEARLLQEYRSKSKMLSTYLSVIYDDDNRMRCSFDPRGTWTGRLSSKQTIFNKGMNLQNLPPAFRGFLEADL